VIHVSQAGPAGALAVDLEAAWEIVRAATPAGWLVGRPMFFGHHRWAVWANGPAPIQEGQPPGQIEGTGATEAEALVDLAAKLRRGPH
jgi:hypothetical protein